MTLLRRYLPLAAACAVAAYAVFRAELLLDLSYQYIHDGFHSYGASLFYGLPDAKVTYSMPVTGVLLALLQRLSPSDQRTALLAIELLPIALAFLAAAALEGTGAGCFAALLTMAVAPVLPGETENSLETLLYGCVLLLVGRALIELARSDDRRSRWVLGASMATALLVRSPIAYFLPVLAAYTVWRRGWRDGMRDAAPALAIPALALIPWVAINWRMFGHFIVFERGRSDLDIVTGAMGWVHTYPYGQQQAFELSQLRPGESVFLWAVVRVLTHPIPYLLAIPGRLFYIVRLHPVLLAAGIAGFWRGRAREDYRMLALLLAAFMGMHCLVSIETRYMRPVWPLVAVLAATLWTALARSEPLPLRKAWAVLMAPLLSVAAASVALAAAYPSRAAKVAVDFTFVLRAHPSESLLWHEAGLRASATAGSPCAAVSAFSKAVLLDPSEANRRDYAKAVMRSSGKQNFLVWPESPVPALAWTAGHSLHGRFLLVDGDLSEALLLHSVGREAAARASFDRFAAAFQADPCRNREQVRMEALQLEQFRDLCWQSKPTLDEWTRGWSAPHRAMFRRRLAFFGCP